MPCDVVAYNEVNPRRRRISFAIEPAGLDFPGSREAFGRHMHEHPIVARYRATGRPEVLTLSDFLTSRQLQGLGLYQEFFRLMRIEHMVVAPLPFRPPLQLGFSLCRHARDFSGRDRLLLARLAPHLARAYRNAEAVTRLGEASALLLHALEATTHGVITLGADGRVREMSACARRWLREYWPGPRRGAGLPDPVRRWLADQLSAPSNGDLPPARSALVAQGDGRRLVARLFRAPSQSVVLLEEEPTELRPSSLAVFGLTRREAEVLAWVAEGKTNPEIARILSASPRTVDKHLEHVYRKLGVENRTAAVRRVLAPGPT